MTDDWNVTPITCEPSMCENPEHIYAKGVTPGDRFRQAIFRREIADWDEISGLTPSPLKEK